MPNWVFNTINGYTKELYDKYKSEDYEIDFSKVILEPEEINNTLSGAYNNIAKKICEYKEFRETKNTNLKYDHRNPIYEEVKSNSDLTCKSIGKLAIKNPNKSLNNILNDEKNKHLKYAYDNHVKIFGNRTFEDVPNDEMLQVFDNWCDVQNSEYQKFLNRDHIKEDGIEYPESLDALGKQLISNEEKYGFDNWYDWRIANWGTKWNACDSEYDEETNTIKFNTAWSIPYQIISKIAQDNPEAKLDGYSEEETGWFDEYHTENGKVHIDCHGELEWPEEDNEDAEPTENREEVNEEFDYNEYIEIETKRWKSFVDGKLANF